MIADTTSITPFPFPVRLHHRETLHSYTSRLLAANFSNQSHLNELTKAMQHGTDLTNSQAATQVIAALTRRPSLLKPEHQSQWGLGAYKQLPDLPTRYACTLCTAGKKIQLRPHLEDLFCRRHRRWLGLLSGPADQHTITTEVIPAQRTFTRLYHENRLEMRLYRITARALAVALHPTLTIEQAEGKVFADTVNLMAAITEPEFSRRLFDTSIPFADNYQTLRSTVHALAPAADQITRALWISLHPTMTYIRNFGPLNDLQRDEVPFPLSVKAKQFLITARGELEPWENYFAVTGDNPGTAARLYNELNALRSPGTLTTPVLFTCPNGHTFDYLPPMYDVTTPRHLLTSDCQRCTTRQPRPQDAFATIRPDLVNSFDRYRNGGLTAADIAASTQIPYWWLCAAGHSHRAYAADMATNYGRCTIHSNRNVVLGINSLIDTHPDIAARSAETWDDPRSPAHNSAGSKTQAGWTCDEGHIFTARYWHLVSGGVKCPQCKKNRRIVRHEDSLAALHPEQAALWHPTRNGPLTPADVTPGQNTKVWWLCSEGHDNQGRIDKRAQGQTCGICTGKKLHPGINDLATREPALSLEYHQDKNPLRANEIFASNHPLHWECFANGHIHKQTTQHRRASRGCPLCPAEERILNQLTAA